MKSFIRTRKNRSKIYAVLSAGLVLGVGATMTLASWSETEWVFGGSGTAGAGVPGVGTSTFATEQFTGAVASAISTSTAFAHNGSNPGAPLSFSPGALSLTPGDSVFAPVAIRTSAASVQGTLQLRPAVAATGITVNDPTSLLRNALQLQVGTITTTGTTPAPACSAAGFASYTPIAVTGTGLNATPATGTQQMAAAGGSIVHYCFQITLPAGSPSTLQGLTQAPAWLFDATSN